MEEEIKKIVYETKGKVDEMSKRLDDISLRLNNLNDGQHMLSKEMGEMKDSFNEKIGEVKDSFNEKMNTQFRWTVGFIMGSWVTLMGTIIALFSILIKTSG